MTFLIGFVITLMILAGLGLAVYYRRRTWVVAEDSAAITVDQDGFIKRVLLAGRHVLRPFEKVAFTVETKTKLATGQVTAVATSDGILINMNWSGTYTLNPGLITENVSQRLRGLPTAEKAISRNADIYLRKLVGDQGLQDLFKPATRERIERQLSQLLADRLKSTGIGFNGLSLQVIDLPREVAEALNRAKAIETLDSAIRQLDPATREVMRSAYQLEEILRWEAHLPFPARLAPDRAPAVAQ